MNIGIIGLGRIGKIHLKAILRVKGAHVVAVTDFNMDLAQEIGEQYQVKHVLPSYKEIVEHPDVDAVWVCSPSSEHNMQVSSALENGKYVFCEKPLDTTIDGIQEMIAKFPDISKKLMVGFNRRFDPNFVSAKNSLSEIGKPSLLKITSRDPSPPPLEYIKKSGGIFKDMTIHDFDMARFLVEDEVESVSVVGNVNFFDDIKGIDIDTALITLKFKNGVLCNIDNSRQCAYGYDQRFEFLGSDGMVQLRNKKNHVHKIYRKDATASSIYQDFFLQRYSDAYISEAKVFIETIEAGEDFSVSADDALKALQLAEACEKSLVEKRTVKMSELS